MNMMLIGLLVALAACGVAGWQGYTHGYEAGEDSKQAAWDDATRKAEADTAKQREAGFVLAEGLEKQLAEMRGKYERSRLQRREAVATQFSCPSSGRIGDVVVPAAVVRSMFNTSPSDPEPAASAASQPAPAL